MFCLCSSLETLEFGDLISGHHPSTVHCIFPSNSWSFALVLDGNLNLFGKKFLASFLFLFTFEPLLKWICTPGYSWSCTRQVPYLLWPRHLALQSNTWDKALPLQRLSTKCLIVLVLCMGGIEGPHPEVLRVLSKFKASKLCIRHSNLWLYTQSITPGSTHGTQLAPGDWIQVCCLQGSFSTDCILSLFSCPKAFLILQEVVSMKYQLEP